MALGIAANVQAKLRHLEQIVRDNIKPCITRNEQPLLHVLHGRAIRFNRVLHHRPDARLWNISRPKTFAIALHKGKSCSF